MTTKFLGTFLLLVVFILQGFAQNADEILNKHIKVSGLDKVKGLKTISTSSTITAQGIEMPMMVIAKRPSSVYTEMTAMGQKIVVGFDGKKGWMVNPMMGTDAVEIPEAQMGDIKNKSPFEQLDVFADYKTLGHKLEYSGKENVSNKPAHKLTMTKKNGDVLIAFVDVSSFLKVKQIDKIKINGQEIEAESSFSDYKEVSGIKYPFKIDVTSSQGNVSVITTKMEVNVPVDESKFIMPAKK